MTQEDPRRFAPATLRNREAIIAVLRTVLPETGTILEIASGSGEHAIAFAQAFPGLVFQPSDADPEALASIRVWCEEAGLANVLAPVHIDAAAPTWPVGAIDAVVCINMIHIAPWASTTGLLRGAAHHLRSAAPLYLYGPFYQTGVATAPSNEAFDASLRFLDPAWGVRNLDDVLAAAAGHGLAAARVVAMPANNLSVVLRRA